MLCSEGWREPWIPSGPRSLFYITAQHERVWGVWWLAVHQCHSSRVTLLHVGLSPCEGCWFQQKLLWKLGQSQINRWWLPHFLETELKEVMGEVPRPSSWLGVSPQVISPLSAFPHFSL